MFPKFNIATWIVENEYRIYVCVTHVKMKITALLKIGNITPQRRK